MQASSTPLPVWSRGRFVLVAALLFAGQAGLVFLLGERPHTSPSRPAPRAVLRLLDAPLNDDKLTKRLFAVDPRVFPASSPHGFAAQAWQLLAARDHEAASLRQPLPAFLEFTNWRGAERPPAVPDLFHTSFQWPGRPNLAADNLPALPAADTGRPESFFLIEGALAARRISPPVDLPAWTNSLLSNSVVQFAVNRFGQVVSTVLLSASGLKSADDSALTNVNILRFRPSKTAAPEYEWDTATFYWKTVPPPPPPPPPKPE